MTGDNNAVREEAKIVESWGKMTGVDCNRRLSYNLRTKLGEGSAF